ncbi:cyclin-dependent kinase 11B-like isoform X7 [Dendrobates tinctorius]|uniref:cyclin-dependent kinase 11B-like isoform X7 n=1 Tax=Dendrobates tinctorius TaxID=92724 RepID=UPI003CCA1BF3
MGDEKDTWKVKTLDEILQEKKRRKEQEEKTDSKHTKNADDRDSKRDSLEEGELRDHKMEITIRNSPYRREDSVEDRGEEDDSLAIKPPQQVSRKEKSHHRKEEKRKEKRRHRSHSAEGKYMRVKEKDREHERRKRHREEQDKVRRERERLKRRELAREHSRRERDRLEQLERERERKQREQNELKERHRRAEERRKGREARREVSAHHRTAREEHGDKNKANYRSRSRIHQQRERVEGGDLRKNVKEDRPDVRDLLSDLQDISDSERKTSSTECSTAASGSGTEEEEETSSEESEEPEDEEEDDEEEEDEEEETESNSEAASEQTAEEVSDEEMSEEEERENGNHVPVVTESRFDHDSPESEEEEEEEEKEEIRIVSPLLSAQTEGEFVPNSPVMTPLELKQELPKYLPALQGCRSVEEFQCLNRIEEGTYGVVYRAKDKKTDEIVALKRLKMEKEKEGFPITSLREINTILKAQHENIVRVREIVVGSNMDKIYIVMNYVEHDLKSLMETMKQPFLPGEVKTLMIQLLRGVRHLHDNWILHRDLKTSNLLLSHAGILKVGDFGLAREYGSPLKPYTPIVVTLWYRAPELLLGAKEYSTAIDLWSVGCIFGELLTQKPLFQGKSEIDQINKVFKDLGTPSEKIWPGYNELPAIKKMTFSEYPYNNLRKRFGALLSDQGFDLMNKFLTYCPAKRINAEDALKHEYFCETPLPIDPSMFPTWPAKSEQPRVKRATSPRPPEGGLGYSQLGDDDLKDTGFHLTTTNQGASAAGPGFSLKF